MRKLIKKVAVTGLLLCLAMIAFQAFTPPAVGSKYQYGYRKAVTLTSDTVITVAPNNLTLTYATLSLDTNATVGVNVGNSIVGDRIILQVTADASNRHLIFGDNVAAITDSVVATKTKMFEFVYNGTEFKQVAESDTD